MERELDRLSNLPSDVICQILSPLPIREAARTSVLSSKWRYKFATLPNLEFDAQCVSTKKDATFAKVVDHVLLGHIGPIHTFKLSPQDLLAAWDIDRWILHLSRNPIKEFMLKCCTPCPYKMPSCFFSFQDMIELDLFNCVLKPPSTFKGFKNLKNLHIGNATLAQDVFENLIAGSPRLERLIMFKCDGFTHLKIHAPNLRFLTALGDFEDVEFENTVNLDFVYISMKAGQRLVPGNSSNLAKFCAQVPHIEELGIDSSFLQYLAAGKMLEKLSQPCQYLLLLSMTIRFNNPEQVLTALCLLRSSPALEHLDIVSYPEDQAVVGEVNSLLDDNLKCQFTQLRTVEFHGISGVIAELDIIRFVLSSAPMLESLTVKPASVYGFPGVVVAKLLQFRRASVHAQIIFLDP